MLPKRRLAAPAPQCAKDLVEMFLSTGAEGDKADFVDTAGAARMLRVSRRTVQAWIDEDRVKAVRVGKKYWLYVPSIRECLKRTDSSAATA
jgi:excisionase family DNA binding protein